LDAKNPIFGGFWQECEAKIGYIRGVVRKEVRPKTRRGVEGLPSSEQRMFLVNGEVGAFSSSHLFGEKAFAKSAPR
jgi:hypothetical protein